MGISPVVDSPPLLEVELCFIFEDETISIISINLSYIPTHDIRAAGNENLSNSLATYEKLLNIVESSDK